MDDIFSQLLSMRVDPDAAPVPGSIKTPLTPPLPADLTPETEIVRRLGGTPSCSTCYDKRFDADKAFAPSDPTGWTSERLFDSNLNQWIAIQLPSAVAVKAIAFKGDNDPEPLDSPTSYAFQGSPDDGVTWETLFCVEDTPPYIDPEETRFHPLPVSKPYRSYRLLVTQTAWSKPGNLCGSVVVRDFQLF